MSYYAISFHISTTDRTIDQYQEVRESFLSSVRGHGETYEETRAFLYLKTESPVNDVIKSVKKSLFNPIKKDVGHIRGTSIKSLTQFI